MYFDYCTLFSFLSHLGNFDFHYIDLYHVNSIEEVYEEYHSVLEEENKLESEEWFEKVDEYVFIFKHRLVG